LLLLLRYHTTVKSWKISEHWLLLFHHHKCHRQCCVCVCVCVCVTPPPCLRMMRTLLLSPNQGISYKVTHNHLSQFLWTHDLQDGTIKHLQHHHHPVQFVPGIEVHVTLHQRYIRVHLEGLISGVCLLLHQLSHPHRIFRCKPWPLHPYTPWKSVVLMAKSRKVLWKARYHFFERIQGNFLNYGLWIKAKVWR
jgi:hypothetical protein